jgi:hypothetical protein
VWASHAGVCMCLCTAAGIVCGVWDDNYLNHKVLILVAISLEPSDTNGSSTLVVLDTEIDLCNLDLSSICEP